jgi:hypothetical protein
VQELLPGSFTKVFSRVAVEGDLRVKTGLVRLANKVEGRAKDNLKQTSHPYGTATPATPGGPPSLVSGNLRRSLTHSPIAAAGFGSWQTLVGTGVGFFPFYGKTPSNRYGYILEIEGLRNGTRFPFLKPAYVFAIRMDAPVIWRDVMRGGRW